MSNLDNENSQISIEGGTDSTVIGNVGDRLKVTGDAPSPADTPGCPTISTKVRFENDRTTTTLSSSYGTIFTYTGSGKFFGISVEFETVNVEVKLTIDSEVIFTDVLMDELKDNTGDKEFNTGIFYADVSGKKLVVNLSECPIAYDTDILLEARDPGSKKMFGYLVVLSKET